MDINLVSMSDPGQNKKTLEAHKLVSKKTEVKSSEPVRVIPDIESTVKELSKIAKQFNRKLSYSINKDLNIVVVKIIDSETDKVIKELPPEEIQRLHLYLKDASGLFVDEKI